MNKVLIVLLLLLATTAHADVYTTPTSTDVYQLPFWVRGGRNWDDYMNNGLKSIDSVLSILSDDAGSIGTIAILSNDASWTRNASRIKSSPNLPVSCDTISVDQIMIGGAFVITGDSPTVDGEVLSWDSSTGAVRWGTTAKAASSAGDVLDVITVGAGGDHTTITAALAAASAGDTILVAEGTYSEAVDFADDNVAVIATGSRENTTITAAASTVDFKTYSGCVVQGFTIIGTATTAAGPCVVSANNNGYAGPPNYLIDCDVESTGSATNNPNCNNLLISAGNFHSIRCNFVSTQSGASGGNYMCYQTGVGKALYDSCTFDFNTSGAGSHCYGITSTYTNGAQYTVRDSVYTSDTGGSGTSVAAIKGYSAANGNTVYAFNNHISIDISSTANHQGLGPSTYCTMYASNNLINVVNSGAGAGWWGDVSATGGVLYSYNNNLLAGTKGTTKGTFKEHPGWLGYVEADNDETKFSHKMSVDIAGTRYFVMLTQT